MRSNAIYYLLATLISNGVPFLILPFLTRALTPEEFGIVALGQAFGTLTAGLSFQGLNIFFERNFFEWEKRGREKHLLYTFFLYCLAASFLPILPFIFFPEFLSKLIFNNVSYAWVLVGFHLICSANNFRNLFMSYFRCRHDGKSFFWGQITPVFFINLLIVFWTVLNQGSLSSYVYSHLLMNILAVFALALVVLPGGSVFDRTFLKEALPVSLPLTPRIFIGTMSAHIDKYMLGVMGTLGAVGIYSVTQRFAFVVFIGLTTLGNMFTPVVYRKMFEGDSVEIRVEIGRYLTPYFFVGVASTLVLCLFSQELLFVATSKDYHQSYPIIMLLGSYYLLLFFGKQNQLVFKKKSFTITFISFFSALVGAAFNYFFISKWGSLGAALATLLAGLIIEGTGFYLSQRAYCILFEYRKILGLLGYLTVSNLAVCLLAVELPYLQLLFVKIVLLIAFVVFFRKNIIQVGHLFREGQIR